MASASAFQAEDASSILAIRSKKFNEKFGYLKKLFVSLQHKTNKKLWMTLI